MVKLRIPLFCYYKDLIINFIKEYKKASRDDIDKLILDKLSNALNEEQKRTKIKNLLYAMSKKDCVIFNNSKSTIKPEWCLRENKIEFKIELENRICTKA